MFFNADSFNFSPIMYVINPWVQRTQNKAHSFTRVSSTNAKSFHVIQDLKYP